MSADAAFGRPSWLERLPRRADALCVAAAIERNLDRPAWAQAVKDAQTAGFEVDVTYLRDKLTLARMARRSDPPSSHQAAQRVYYSGSSGVHTGMIVDAVRSCPGLTSAELGKITGLERHEAARRTSDAERCGLIRKGASRLCSIGERLAVTWWPTPDDAQRACLRRAA